MCGSFILDNRWNPNLLQRQNPSPVAPGRDGSVYCGSPFHIPLALVGCWGVLPGQDSAWTLPSCGSLQGTGTDSPGAASTRGQGNVPARPFTLGGHGHLSSECCRPFSLMSHCCSPWPVLSGLAPRHGLGMQIQMAPHLLTDIHCLCSSPDAHTVLKGPRARHDGGNQDRCRQPQWTRPLPSSAWSCVGYDCFAFCQDRRVVFWLVAALTFQMSWEASLCARKPHPSCSFLPAIHLRTLHHSPTCLWAAR